MHFKLNFSIQLSSI